MEMSKDKSKPKTRSKLVPLAMFRGKSPQNA